MKKIMSFALTAFLLVGFVNVNAAEVVEVATADALKTCVATSGNTCKLTSSVTLTAPIVIDKEIVLDLNGKAITMSEEVTGTTGIVLVNHGGALTINDTVGTGSIVSGNSFYAPLQVSGPGDTDNSKVASLIINGGTFEGRYYAIVGNGSTGRDNTSIVINGGTLKSNFTGIYHPQKGKLVINGGEITGAQTGIEMRSGSLTVNGGIITGNGIPADFNSNGSGTTTTGAGIAVSQHTTALELSAVIKGGTINGYSALYQVTAEATNDVSVISLEVSGGTFNAINGGTVVVYSEDFTGFVTGGTYDKELTASYIKEGYESIVSNGTYTVAKIVPEVEVPTVDTTEEVEEVKVGVFEVAKTEEILLESLEENEDLADAIQNAEVKVQVEIAPVDETRLDEEVVADMEKEAGKATIATYFDVTIAVTANGNQIGTLDELTEEIELMVLLPEELRNTDKNVKRTYYVVRHHETSDGTEVKLIKATLSDDGKSLVFKTDKFSTYALAYEDTNVAATNNPATGNSISLYLLLAGLSIVGLAGAGLFVNKKRLSN